MGILYYFYTVMESFVCFLIYVLGVFGEIFTLELKHWMFQLELKILTELVCIFSFHSLNELLILKINGCLSDSIKITYWDIGYLILMVWDMALIRNRWGITYNLGRLWLRSNWSFRIRHSWVWILALSFASSLGQVSLILLNLRLLICKI